MIMSSTTSLYSVFGGVSNRGRRAQAVVLNSCGMDWLSADYSYLSASTGSIRVARQAG